MKKTIIAAAALCAAVTAFADTSATSGSTATGAAVNAGVNTNIGFNTTTPAYTATDVRYSGLEKPSANVQLTAIAPPPSPRTCADTGMSLGGGGRGGSAIVAFGTGAEEGCDVGRDVEIVDWVLKLPPESVQYKVAIARICVKKEIRASFEAAGEAARCQTAAQRESLRAQKALNGGAAPVASADPYIAASGRQYPSPR